MNEKEYEKMKSIKDMTLEEKILQTVIYPITKDFFEGKATKEILKKNIGGYFVGKEIIKDDIHDKEKIAALTEKMKRDAEIVPIVCGDFENGCGGAVASLTSLPKHMALGAAGSLGLAYDYGKTTAVQGRLFGANTALAPVVDLNINPRNDLVSTRSAGDAPDRVIPILTQEINGMQENGLFACLKHYPGDGVDWRNQHMVTTKNSLDRQTWENTYGRVYRELIKAGADMIMIGHISCPALQKERFGGLPLPGSLSSELIGHLKNEIGFEGICMSDALSMGGFLGWYDDPKTAQLECFKAGIDMLLFPDWEYCTAVKEAVENGEIAMERLDDAVLRILRVKEKIYKAEQKKKESEHEAILFGENISARVAEKSLTLIAKDSFVPLKADDKVMVVYLRQTEEGDNISESLGTFGAELKKRCREVTEVENLWLKQKTASEFDRIIYLANSTDICLPDAWMSLCHNVDKSVVISFRSPYYREYFERAKYVINAYSDTESSQKAAVRGLFGEIKMDAEPPVDIDKTV